MYGEMLATAQVESIRYELEGQRWQRVWRAQRRRAKRERATVSERTAVSRLQPCPGGVPCPDGLGPLESAG